MNISKKILLIVSMCLIAFSAFAADISNHVFTSMTLIAHCDAGGQQLWAGCSVKTKDGTIKDLEVKKVTGKEAQVTWMTPRGATAARISLWEGKEKCKYFGKCDQCKKSNKNYHMVNRLADTQWQKIGTAGGF